MKRLLVVICCLPLFLLHAQDVIYDESKVPSYILPPILTTNNGEDIHTIKQWEEIRRPELLNVFAGGMFGFTPSGNISVSYDELHTNNKSFNGKATCKQIKVTFSNGFIRREAIILMYLPNEVKGKVPVFLSYNFNGNQTISDDPEIIPSTNANRGNQKSRWPLDMILSAGYGVVTAWYGDFFPDARNKHCESILPLYGFSSIHDIKGNSWQAIGAWSWGLSHIMDYLETDDRIDESKVILMGHSRQGKAALWAGAQDTRFAVVISNNSGCGGAALSKRTFGETIVSVTNTFPHWFCYNLNHYANNEEALTFDQHQLLSLIAPRPLYVASAEEDKWADPKGEYLSAYHAGEVYQLYGMKGLETAAMPAVNQPVMNRIGYHIRTGIHDVTDFDWKNFISFVDKWLR